MNNFGTVAVEADTSVADPVRHDLTAGAMLRQAREAAGLHVAALAVAMKIPVKKLEALEANQLDTMLDPVFVRALAASVCRALKIDPQPVLDKLPQNRNPRLDGGGAGINAPFHASGHTPGLFVPAYFAKPGFVVVLALLVGAAVVVYFPDIKTSEYVLLSEQANPTVPPVAVQAPASPSVSSAVLGGNDGVAGVPVDPVPTQPGAFENAPAVEPSATSLPGVLAGLVVFKAKGDSWVEVVDAKGVVQLRRLFAAGDTDTATGALPLSVVVGRAQAIDVEVRGKPIEFTNVSKDGVVRFEVK